MTDYLDTVIDFNQPTVANAFDELPLWAARFGALLLDNLPFARDITALDVGPGTGFPLFELAHRFGESCRFIAVDPWKAALDRAATKRRYYQWLKQVWLIQGDAARLPLPDASVSLITSNLGINNFDDPPAVMAECVRVAKRGARLALTTNLTGHMREFYAVFADVLRDFGNPQYEERLGANEAHRGTVESVRALIEGGGFQVARVIQEPFPIRYADGSAMLRHSLTRIGFLPAWRAVVDPADEQAVFAELEKRLNTLAAEQGELRVTIPMLYLEAVRA
jgi:ubiquinone/menaquinone biosynthesis C-methylase UbiE